MNSTALRLRATELLDDSIQEQSWESLQQEINDRLIQLKKLTELGITGGLEDSLEAVNAKIERYNELVPSLSMQQQKLDKNNFIHFKI